jgi:hypothetical protein
MRHREIAPVSDAQNSDLSNNEIKPLKRSMGRHSLAERLA